MAPSRSWSGVCLQAVCTNTCLCKMNHICFCKMNHICLCKMNHILLCKMNHICLRNRWLLQYSYDITFYDMYVNIKNLKIAFRNCYLHVRDCQVIVLRSSHINNHKQSHRALQTFHIESTVGNCYNQTASSFPTVVSSQQLSHSRFPTADFQESTAQPNTPKISAASCSAAMTLALSCTL